MPMGQQQSFDHGVCYLEGSLGALFAIDASNQVSWDARSASAYEQVVSDLTWAHVLLVTVVMLSERLAAP